MIEYPKTIFDGVHADEDTRRIRKLERENAALRRLAHAMADEMELHGGEMVFASLVDFRAARAKEGQP